MTFTLKSNLMNCGGSNLFVDVPFRLMMHTISNGTHKTNTMHRTNNDGKVVGNGVANANKFHTTIIIIIIIVVVAVVE